MKKKLLVLTLAMMTTATVLTACGEKKDDKKEETKVEESSVVLDISDSEGGSDEFVENYGGDEEVGDYPFNEFEERVGKTSFESYDEIVGLLEGDEAYAYVNVLGYDGQVLMISEFAYDNGDGNMASVEATIYSKKSDGRCTADSIVYTGGTATPIAIDDDGVIITATHLSVEKQCYGDNGTDEPAIMYLESISAESFDDDGNFVDISGFLRTDNTLIDDEITDIASDDVAAIDAAFADYYNAHVVNFTNISE